MFFSSHVLSDAETLCTRVAILARGRLVASGALSEMLAFQVRGWELIVSALPEAALEHARRKGDVVRATMLGAGRYALELPLSTPPERVLAELTAQGAQLVSLTPMRETLEDFFVRQIDSAPRDRGLHSVGRA